MTEAMTMDYAGIKAKRKTGQTPTIEDLRTAVETEKGNLIRQVVELAEAEAKEYRLMGIFRLGHPELEAHTAKTTKISSAAREARRHLAKLINMLHHVENPDEKSESESETCQACNKPIETATVRAGKFSFHASCVENEEEEDYGEEDAEEDQDDNHFAS